MKILKVIFSVVLLGSFALKIFPAERGTVNIVVGDIQSISVHSPTRVSVRNPSIVDIVKVDRNEIVLAGKKEGSTVLRIWEGGQEFDYPVNVYKEDLAKLKKKITDILQNTLGIKTVVAKIDYSIGKIVLTGAARPQQKENISKMVAPFSDKIENFIKTAKESKMVKIDAEILEINKTELEQLGIRWQDYLQIREEPYQAPSSSSTSGVETTLNKITNFSKLWGISQASRDALTARINMLIQTGKAKELSRPKLLCLSGEEAKLTVGGEVPYISGSTTSSAGTGISIEYKDYGVILTIRPIVLDNDKVFMNIKAEVSALDWANAITVNNTSVPAFTKREAETVLNINSGTTIFIAGLIKNTESKNINRLPALGKLPILGALFRSKNFQNNQTELVITLTPKIVDFSPKEKFSSQDTEEINRVVFPKKSQPAYGKLSQYILEIQQKIAKSLAYPKTALDTGWQGTVKIRLHLKSNGELVSAVVISPSGYKSFDEAAVNTAKALSPYAPLPFDIDQKDIWMDIPIVYKAN